MARDSSGNASRVVTPPQAGDTARSADYNSEVSDIYSMLSDSINKDGTKAFGANQSMGGFRLTNVGDATANGDAVSRSYGDTRYQGLDATLTAMAAGTTGSDVLWYWSGSDTLSTMTLTSAARSILDDASVAAIATTLGLGTGNTPQFNGIELSHATENTLTAASGILSCEGVAQVNVSASQTLTNKTLTSPTINGGTASPRVQDSSETGGSLTSASANKRVVCASAPTLPSTGMTSGDFILIDPGGTARVVTRPGAHTMYVRDVDVASDTTFAHNIAVAIYHGSSKWTLHGMPA